MEQCHGTCFQTLMILLLGWENSFHCKCIHNHTLTTNDERSLKMTSHRVMRRKCEWCRKSYLKLKRLSLLVIYSHFCVKRFRTNVTSVSYWVLYWSQHYSVIMWWWFYSISLMLSLSILYNRNISDFRTYKGKSSPECAWTRLFLVIKSKIQNIHFK